jgi:hypothetical protein
MSKLPMQNAPRYRVSFLFLRVRLDQDQKLWGMRKNRRFAALKK